MCSQLILLFVVVFYRVDSYYLGPQPDLSPSRLQWPSANGLIRSTAPESSESWLDSYLAKSREESTKSPSIASVLASAASSVLAKLSEPSNSKEPSFFNERPQASSSYLHPINSLQSYMNHFPRSIVDSGVYPPGFAEYVRHNAPHHLPTMSRRINSFPPENGFRIGSRSLGAGDIYTNRPVGRIPLNYDPFLSRGEMFTRVPYGNSPSYVHLAPGDYSDIINTKDNGVNRLDNIYKIVFINDPDVSSAIAPVNLGIPAKMQQPLFYVSSPRQGENDISNSFLTNPTTNKQGLPLQQIQVYYPPFFGHNLDANERFGPFIPSIGSFERPTSIALPQEIPRHTTHFPGFSTQQTFGINPYIFGQQSLIQPHNMFPAEQTSLGSSPATIPASISKINYSAVEVFSTPPSELKLRSEDTAKSSSTFSHLQNTTPASGFKPKPGIVASSKVSESK